MERIKKIKLLSLQRFEPRAVQPAAGRYSDYAIQENVQPLKFLLKSDKSWDILKEDLGLCTFPLALSPHTALNTKWSKKFSEEKLQKTKDSNTHILYPVYF